MKLPLAVLTLGFALSSFAHNKVIYGVDNRHEVYNYPRPEVQELAKSTVALIRTGDLQSKGELIALPGMVMRESMNMCSSERFTEQPTAAFCSGFLIAPNKIVTAGHCITSDSACAETSFVFDYQMNNDKEAQLDFNPSQIFSCKKVLGQVEIGNSRDFAVVELDRPVEGRQILKMSTNKNLTPGDEVFVIGHPAGLPTKITDSAKVREVKNDRGYFVTNLDTYGGNSGSAVFNAKTLEIEGILVRGDRDYLMQNDCRVSNVVDEDGGRGEDVTLISAIHENGFETEPEVETPSTNSQYIWIDIFNACFTLNEEGEFETVAPALCGH